MSRGRRTTGCLPDNPSSSCIYLDNVAVNLSAISRSTGLSKSFLSLVIAGKRGCRVHNYRKIAAAIGMGLEQLLDAIDSRKLAIESAKVQIMEQYKTRIAEEDKEDRVIKKRGRIPKPRLPGLRLA